MSEILGRVIICRAVKDGLTPGARIGYACSVCQEPLQLTLGGLGILAEYPDSPLLCNECGFLYVQIAEARGELAGTQQSPQAKAQLDAGNDSVLARWLRKRA